jgi:hypothetical protein
LPKPIASVIRTLSARRPLDQSIARCNSTQSNQLSPVEFWPTREQYDPPANELRSMREQRRAWIKQLGVVNIGYSRKVEIMRGYLKVKRCSHG